jgi:hypothetical protein
MMAPEAWLVVYPRLGKEDKYVALDRFVAEDFAVRYNGILYPLYKELS